jgi:hypothetical protein
MILQHNLEEVTTYLQENLVGYEVIPANFGWHIHKQDTYYGLLEYQKTKGWYGKALSCLPLEVREKLKKFELSNSSMPFLAA